MNQWSQFLLWNFVYDCMFIVILTDGELGAISRETVYYMRRPFRIIYLLMAGRKPIFSKTVCHIWPWNSQPWLFYITFLYLFSITLCLLSNIYYLLSIIKVCYLLSIAYYPLSIVHIFIIYNLLSRLSLLSIADPQPWWMWCNICIVKAVENMKTAVINNLVIVFIYMLCENIHHYWGNVIRLIKLHCCCFFIYLHAFEFSGMQITQRKT